MSMHTTQAPQGSVVSLLSPGLFYGSSLSFERAGLGLVSEVSLHRYLVALTVG